MPKYGGVKTNDGAITASALAIGMLIGAASGLAAGLLFAPQSGTETRNMVREKARNARVRANVFLGRIKEAALRATGREGRP